MELSGRVHPECANASNPYHVCAVRCLEKIARGEGKKDRRKKDPFRSPKGGKPIGYVAERKVNPNCPKASNPYHECNGSCSKGIGGSDPQGIAKNPASKLTSGEKMKAPQSQPKTYNSQANGAAANVIHPAEDRPNSSHTSSKERNESEYGESFSSSSKHSRGIDLRNDSLNQEQDHSSHAMDMTGSSTPNRHRDETPTELVSHENHQEVPDAPEDSRSFSFSGIVRPVGHSDDDDDEENLSVMSDASVMVGNYRVRASVSPILQSIIEKHGDIAAGCQLESVSMRAYYLECLCAVVQELTSTSFEKVIKSRVKEMLAILKDVESVKIEVDWLRGVLNELLEAVELRDQPRSEKEKHEQDLDSTKKELETQLEELQRKEQELIEVKARLAETKARVDEIEHERSHLNKKAESMKSTIEKFSGKSVLQEL